MNSELVQIEPKAITSDLPLVLEIGSGKGKFITELANMDPSKFYIAMEKDLNVCYRILEKQEQLKLPNLQILPIDAKELLQYFKPKSITKIYLNFSDPWPKKRHHKRRLTAVSFLKLYETLLKDGGELEFRTDHSDLFNDSITYLNESKFKLITEERNCAPRAAISEYELKKREFGPIYGFIARKD